MWVCLGKKQRKKKRYREREFYLPDRKETTVEWAKVVCSVWLRYCFT